MGSTMEKTGMRGALALGLVLLTAACGAPSPPADADPGAVPGSQPSGTGAQHGERSLAPPELGTLVSRFRLQPLSDAAAHEAHERQASERARGASDVNVVLASLSSSALTRQPGDTRKVECVDLNADGLADLFALNYDQPNELHVNQGDGTFDGLDRPDDPLIRPRKSKGVDFADLDGDGDLDGFLVVGNNLPNVVLRNATLATGTGTRTDASGGGSENEPDDAQGHPPQVGPAPAFELWEIDGLGDGRQAYDAEFGDLNGDGLLDLVVSNRNQPNDIFLRLPPSATHGERPGQSGFARLEGVASLERSNSSREVDLADLDGDGDLEILVANGSDQHNDVLVNMGGRQAGSEGAFEPLVDVLSGDGGRSFGLAVGDLDGDGLPEVAVANRDQSNALYHNLTPAEGTALRFERVHGSALDANQEDSYDVEFADLDNNGVMDIVVVNRKARNALYMGRGAHAFSRPERAYRRVDEGQLVEDLGNTRCIALADVFDYPDPLNGRPIVGALELLVGNTSDEPNQLYMGFGAQWSQSLASKQRDAPALSGHGSTRPGAAATLLLEGAPASQQVFMLLSLEPARLPFRGALLGLDPAPPSGGALSGFTTDAQGFLGLSMKVPDDVGELPPGVELYLAAVVADPSSASGWSVSNTLRAVVMP
ncbi:MAG: hypothetical protein DRQ55_06815 [Planctomycetota bacterium]|nr:MAG: hypothetical protein DRQ55_06815 [Planctomycetota bacterium]